MTFLPGIGLVLAITSVAGVIAYIGDRVGHQVGRKRLTLFGLRPKYTSTIIAIATGMLIALSVTVAALVASSSVRTAFFRMGQINAQINELRAQAAIADAELQNKRNGRIVLPLGTLLTPFWTVMQPTEKPADAELRFGTFFDETVRYVNANLTKAPYLLQPDNTSFADPKVRADVRRILADARERYDQGDVKSPVVFVPVAQQNLFRGEKIAFTFAYYADRKLASANEALATYPVEGGRVMSDLDARQLFQRALEEAVRRGFPAPFAPSPFNGFNTTRLAAASEELSRVKGRYRLVARASTDLYPHSGRLLLDVTVEPAPA